ncbi:MAG: 4-hydroxy-tetrahydrodipicolinate reductase [Planctomycetota bacterium]|nr:4-hydroxy-tetrahydrodipicolinate reductase [Planctomycetota bacterium]
MIHVVISGAAGRMGRTLVRLVQESQDLKLVGAVEAPGHPCLGNNAGLLAGAGEMGVPMADALPETFDALVDFSLPEGSLGRIEKCAAAGLPCVVGTTGFSAEQRARIKAAAERTAVVLSPNMSVGVNVLFHVAAELARTLGAEYDIEIVEAHHRFKKDAPSGTALKVAEEIAKATGRNLAEAAVHGRGPGHPARRPGEIGIHAIRGGDIVGEHIIYYSALGERLELKHVAHSRETFARGALRAARWVADRGPGLYSMADVLGL